MFCFIIGSFGRTQPKLRYANSDIDLVCDVRKFDEIYRALVEKYPEVMNSNSIIKLDFQNPEIVKNDPQSYTIKLQTEYWNECYHVELFNSNPNVKFKFECEKLSNFVHHLRDPNVKNLEDYMKKDTIKMITVAKFVEKILNKTDYNNVKNIDKLKNVIEKKDVVDNETKILFEKLIEHKFKVNNDCQEKFGLFINVDKKNKTVEDQEGKIKMSYENFLGKCFKNDETNQHFWIKN
jgi:hypothetical protein